MLELVSRQPAYSSEVASSSKSADSEKHSGSNTKQAYGSVEREGN